MLEINECKIKIAELENILEQCNQFFELIPITTMKKGMTWMPSDHALLLGERAKKSINDYIDVHLHNAKDS